MDANRKREFITELANNIIQEILARVDQMPEEWDGTELRRYIAAKFERESFRWSEQPKRRQRNYRNECLVRNL